MWQSGSGRSHPGVGQNRAGLKKIDAILAASGTSKSKILSANVWVTTSATRRMNAAWTAWRILRTCRRELPSRRSWGPRMLVEIMVTLAK